MQAIGSEDNFPANRGMELKFEAEHLLSHVLLNKEFPPASDIDWLFSRVQ